MPAGPLTVLGLVSPKSSSQVGPGLPLPSGTIRTFTLYKNVPSDTPPAAGASPGWLAPPSTALLGPLLLLTTTPTAMPTPASSSISTASSSSRRLLRQGLCLPPAPPAAAGVPPDGVLCAACCLVGWAGPKPGGGRSALTGGQVTMQCFELLYHKVCCLSENRCIPCSRAAATHREPLRYSQVCIPFARGSQTGGERSADACMKPCNPSRRATRPAVPILLLVTGSPPDNLSAVVMTPVLTYLMSYCCDVMCIGLAMHITHHSVQNHSKV